MLLLGVVEQEAELHALARELPVGQRSHPGKDGRETGLRFGEERGPRRAVRPPVADHLLQIVDEQGGGGLEVPGPPIAVARGAVLRVEVGRGTGAGTGARSVEILTPEEELDGVVAGGDVRLDPLRFVEGPGQQGRGDHGRVCGLAVDDQLRIRDDVDGVEGVLVGIRAVGGVDVVDEPFVQGPGVHPSLPVVDDRVAEAVHLRLLVRRPGRDPGGAGRAQGRLARPGDECVDGGIEGPRGGQGILVARERDVRVGVEDRLGRRRLRGGRGAHRDAEREPGRECVAHGCLHGVKVSFREVR